MHNGGKLVFNGPIEGSMSFYWCSLPPYFTFVRVPRSLRRERARSINAHKGAMEAMKQKLRDQQSETYAHSIVSQANATVLEITREAKRSVDQAKKVHWGSSP